MPESIIDWSVIGSNPMYCRIDQRGVVLIGEHIEHDLVAARNLLKASDGHRQLEEIAELGDCTNTFSAS